MRAYKKGFTLLELIVVILVLGILSAISISRFVSLKESAYIASMKADLRNFALYEQNYMMDTGGSYFSGNGAAQGFKHTPGVTIAAVADPGPPPSWSATATHDKTPKTCQIVTNGPAIWDISCP
jgi:prepilin-type N-terminal cleavage/methylation domain-containing protein